MQEKPSKDEASVEEPASTWQFKQDDQSQPDSLNVAAVPAEVVNWSALEFVEHEKNQNWYVALGGGAIAFSVLVYFLTSKDIVSALVVIIVAVAFGAFASRKPRELPYALDSSGVRIGEKIYQYDSFKSFSVVQEDDVKAVWLLPLKRFMPIIPIYFHPDDEPKIVAALANVLPLENREPDTVDKLMHRVRF